MEPQVDVVVPCYNYGRYLPACLSSILVDGGSSVRVLVIDDASTDNSAEVAQELARNDARVQFHRHASNRGHIATYNEGLLDWASAPYSLLISADDLVAPGALTRAVDLLNDHSEIGMAFGMATIFSDECPPPRIEGSGAQGSQIISSPKFIEQICAAGNGVPTPSVVVRTALQKKIGGYKPALPHSGDMEMWLRFAIHAPVGILEAVQAFYRVHNSNMSLQYYTHAIRDRREQLHAARGALELAGDTIPGFDVWVRDMAKRFSHESFWTGSRAFDRGDVELCSTCMEHAREFDPGVTRSSHWRRFLIKRALGPALSRRFQRLLGREAEGAPADISQTRAPPPGNQIGWWPEPLKS